MSEKTRFIATDKDGRVIDIWEVYRRNIYTKRGYFCKYISDCLDRWLKAGYSVTREDVDES